MRWPNVRWVNVRWVNVRTLDVRWLKICSLSALAVTCALLPTTAVAQEEPNLEFFYPVVTRRPVVERELELRTQYQKSGGEKQIETSAAIEWLPLPRWEIELEIPVVVNLEQGGPSTAGFGDVEIENKFLLWRSVEHRFLFSGGFELKLPSGSQSRGLGGEFAVEPFFTAAIAIGPFDLIGSVAYEWNLNANVKGPHPQEFSANLALGWPVSRWFTPFVEVNTVTQTVGVSDEDANLLHRVQVYLTPGLNFKPLPGTTVRVGVQLPVTSARQFDYAVHAGVVWEF